MNKSIYPQPKNETERVIHLSSFNLDFGELKNSFKNLTQLAAEVAGTDISLINLIDSYTQWTISSHGWDVEQLEREKSVCQYTICQDEYLEVKDLFLDDRFKGRDYVKEKKLRYYFGIPLKTNEGYNLGALCVLHKEKTMLDSGQVALLRIIASEIISKLQTVKVVETLKHKVYELRDAKLKVAHDVRGPLSGIIGLTQCLIEQGGNNKPDEVLQFLSMMEKSAVSILDLADEILADEKKLKAVKTQNNTEEFNLLELKNRIEKLYHPQALLKQIHFSVHILAATEDTTLNKNKLLQIAGNLICNAIKFTPEGGVVFVELEIISEADKRTLKIVVKDSGVGITQESIRDLLGGDGNSTNGTAGEQGYGFGLVMVKHLVDTLEGTLQIASNPGQGSTFTVMIPQ